MCSHQVAQSEANTGAKVHLLGPRSQVAYVVIYFERREETFHKILFYNLEENGSRFSHMVVQPCRRSQHISKTTCALPGAFEIIAKNKQIKNSIEAAKSGAEKLKEINEFCPRFTQKNQQQQQQLRYLPRRQLLQHCQGQMRHLNIGR